MSETVLQARDVFKTYRKHQVLRGVDLTVAPEQLVAVVGENGAGKSTLLKILARTLAADGGSVRLAGMLGLLPAGPGGQRQPHRRPAPALLRRRLRPRHRPADQISLLVPAPAGDRAEVPGHTTPGQLPGS